MTKKTLFYCPSGLGCVEINAGDAASGARVAKRFRRAMLDATFHPNQPAEYAMARQAFLARSKKAKIRITIIQ